MHISKTALDPYTKLFSAPCKPKDHTEGFPTYYAFSTLQNR